MWAEGLAAEAGIAAGVCVVPFLEGIVGGRGIWEVLSCELTGFGG